MHPILLQIGSLTLYSYGLFVGLGFLSAVTFAGKRAAARGVEKEMMTDLFFLILVSSIIGARLFYVLIEYRTFLADPIAIFKIWTGGLVFYGGFITALISALVYVKKKGLPLWPTADILAPAIALGHAVGRIGCFFAGCCYGRQCDLPWAVTFSDPHSLAPLGIHLHPTQLYSVLSNLLILVTLLWVEKRRCFDAIRFDGMIFWLYITLYGLFRSFVEIFRGDPRGSFWAEALSVSQGIGLTMSLVGIGMGSYLYFRKKNRSDG